MREIIYIQAGTFANYAGTHFWNTQEAYLNSEESNQPFVDESISFRESLSSSGVPTSCPRLLVFDHKANFGTLAKSNALTGIDVDQIRNEDTSSLWDGLLTKHQQAPIPKSSYQNHMDESESVASNSNGPPPRRNGVVGDVRFWPDFSRVYYTPRSIQQLPDRADWETPDGDWAAGQEMFTRFNEDTSLMEGPFRQFLEECDYVQGMQITNDTSTFGSFLNAFLTSVRDEFSKMPCMVFPFLSDAVSRHVDVDDSQGTRRMVNDALYLRGLTELSTLTIPTQPPLAWATQSLDQWLSLDRKNVYETSALVSAHIESSTLPLRLSGTHHDIASFSAQLNGRGNNNFAHLGGVFPVSEDMQFERDYFDFTSCRLDEGAKTTFYTRRDVLRGFSPRNLLAYDEWSLKTVARERLVERLEAPAYPLPTSFPEFFRSPLGLPRRGVLSNHPLSTPTFSSLSTSSGTARLFSRYAIFMETCLTRKTGAGSTGLERDDIKELIGDLWKMHDDFSEDGDGMTVGEEGTDSWGEDEE